MPHSSRANSTSTLNSPHLHVCDERVGGDRQASQERRLAHPERPETLRFLSHASNQNTGYSSVQVLKVLGHTTSGRPFMPNGYWDRKASQTLHKCKESGQPPSRSRHHHLRAGHLQTKKGRNDNVYFDAIMESVSTFASSSPSQSTRTACQRRSLLKRMLAALRK